MTDQLVLVASPGLRRPQVDASASREPELRAVVRTGRAEVGPWTVVDEAGCVRTYFPRPVLCFSTPWLIRSAVLAGAGAAVVPRTPVAEDIADGRLVEWGVVQAPAIEGWVLHASRRLVSPKVSAFVNFLCERFA